MEKAKKRRSHFSRRNLIALALLFFYLGMVMIVGAGIDANALVFKDNNPIMKFAMSLGFQKIYGSTPAWVMEVVFVIYIFLLTAALMFEYRMAKYYDGKVWSKKWVLVYGLTIVICLVMAFGIGVGAQYPYTQINFHNSFLFVWESLWVGFLLFLMVALFITALVTLWTNLRNIDKPMKLISREVEEQEDTEQDTVTAEKARVEQQGRLAESFGEVSPSVVNAQLSGNLAGVNGAVVARTAEVAGNDLKLADKEKVFPGLCKIDYEESAPVETHFDETLTLKDLVTGFRNYLAKTEKLYFEESTIRSFIAGLAASRLLILEGLSGTGKSSLARYFSEYIGEKSFFEPVQATWRDRTSILGYYNDFSSSYHETEFLKRLYGATYRPHNINVMVLDELNISRVEYYFADFLSILEYPVADWKLKILELPYDFEAPTHLEDGILEIAPTTWFVGTANKDDSTFTITDKVYDRAITISFDERNEPFEVTGEVKKVALSYDRLEALYAEAEANPDWAFTSEDYKKFQNLVNFAYEKFDLAIGNRILHQIQLLVPVYVAAGGLKEDALDFMFDHKVLSKLEGRYEDYIRSGLLQLKEIIAKTYGEKAFPESRAHLERIVRKLS
jgi:MoxR-like ATPase